MSELNIDHAMTFVDRRKHLGERMPRCPSCCSSQVHLVAYIEVTPAEWKCRTCRFNFAFEPERLK